MTKPKHGPRPHNPPPGPPLDARYICARICPIGLMWRGHSRWTPLSAENPPPDYFPDARAHGAEQRKRPIPDRPPDEEALETDPHREQPPTGQQPYNAPPPPQAPATPDQPPDQPTAAPQTADAAAHPDASDPQRRHTRAAAVFARLTTWQDQPHPRPNPLQPYVITPRTHVLDKSLTPIYNTREEERQP